MVDRHTYWLEMRLVESVCDTGYRPLTNLAYQPAGCISVAVDETKYDEGVKNSYNSWFCNPLKTWTKICVATEQTEREHAYKVWPGDHPFRDSHRKQRLVQSHLLSYSCHDRHAPHTAAPPSLTRVCFVRTGGTGARLYVLLYFRRYQCAWERRKEHGGQAIGLGLLGGNVHSSM